MLQKQHVPKNGWKTHSNYSILIENQIVPNRSLTHDIEHGESAWGPIVSLGGTSTNCITFELGMFGHTVVRKRGTYQYVLIQDSSRETKHLGLPWLPPIYDTSSHFAVSQSQLPR